MDTLEKLGILGEAALRRLLRVVGKRKAGQKGGLGNAHAGICHSWTEDGRCVPCLKFCCNACAYNCLLRQPLFGRFAAGYLQAGR